MERLLETISYDADQLGDSGHAGDPNLKVDARYVDEHLGNLAKDEDLSRYIL
jgi:ATP-dependent HslUV protease ATP-binding subunit HslU